MIPLSMPLGLQVNISTKPDKFALAFLKVWYEEHPDLRYIFGRLTRFVPAEIRDNEIEYGWYSNLCDSIMNNLFIDYLVPDVAEEAGFSEFASWSLPVGNDLRMFRVPEGIKRSYFANKKQWIDAFVRVKLRRNILPGIYNFLVNVVDYDLFIWQYYAPCLIRSNLSEKVEELFPTTPKEHYLDEMANEDPEYAQSCILTNRYFMEKVNSTTEKKLRIKTLSEKVYEMPESGDGPNKIEIAERDEEKWWSFVPFLLLEAGCSMILIEDLVEEGFFDL